MRADLAAEWLDHVRPGWYRKVNLDTLDLQSLNRCVLAQVFGGYGKGMDRLAASPDNYVRLGMAFCSNTDLADWKRLVTVRLGTPITFYVADEQGAPVNLRKCVPPRRRRLLHRRTSHNRSAVGSLQ